MKKVLILSAFILVICFVFSSCAKAHLAKEEIFALVQSQQDLLKQTPAEVQKLGYHSVFISSSEKQKLHYNGRDFQGLYFGANMESADGTKSFDFVPLKSENLSALMQLDGLLSISGIQSEKRLYIIFHCGRESMGSAGINYCFYYTEDDQPVGWNAEEVEFEKSGDGWKWKDTTRGITVYTEKITDHWFYLEATI